MLMKVVDNECVITKIKYIKCSFSKIANCTLELNIKSASKKFDYWQFSQFDS